MNCSIVFQLAVKFHMTMFDTKLQKIIKESRMSSGDLLYRSTGFKTIKYHYALFLGWNDNWTCDILYENGSTAKHAINFIIREWPVCSHILK